MCGIAGIVATGDCRRENVLRAVQAATDAQQHRGPDDSGIAIVSDESPLVVLGHRRLSIIDLTPGGHQPMTDGEGAWITFNGEIYNFRQLRRQLEGTGVRFRTASDTEVILAGYREWGTGVVSRLRGIFAFALWDGRRRTLVLARDHLGVKPLYYAEVGGNTIFASEVRALLASGLVSRTLDVSGLRSYLAYGSIQDPLTLVRDARSLDPAHFAVWHGGSFRTERYWSLPTPPHPNVARDTRFAPAGVMEAMGMHLQDAVTSQLVADVPVGTFLSGGVDSSVIAGLAQRGARTPVRTLGIAFEDARYDESKYARLAARHIGTDHHEMVLAGSEVQRTLPEALSAFDQPSVDGLNTYFVSRMARSAGLTVALSGLGGDEVFGGYEGYRHVARAERWGRRARILPSFARRILAMGLEAVSQGTRVARAADLLTSPNAYAAARRVFTATQSRALLDTDIARMSESWEPSRLSALFAVASRYDPVARASALELQTYMLSTLLRDTDQMSMAHGLEVRVPLLDHLLVEHVFELPSNWRLEPGQPKPFLTRSLPGLVPDECVHRDKRGFALPFAEWFQEVLKQEIRDELLERSSTDAFPFTPDALTNLWRRFQAGALSWSRLWTVFVVRRWLRQHGVQP